MTGKHRFLAVAVAAGDGIRLGRPEGKALVALAGRPLFAHSLGTLLSLPEVASVVLVVRAQDASAVETSLSRFFPADLRAGRLLMALGGATRRQSVHLGLEALAAADSGAVHLDQQDDPVVLIHDAARPLTSACLFRSVAAAAGAAAPGTVVAPALPVVDALRGRDGVAIDRTGLTAVQTPQAARFGFALSAHRIASAQGEQAGHSDDVSVCVAAGGRATLVQGEADNLKVTSAEDLRIAQQLLQGAATPRVGVGFDIHPLVALPGGLVRLAGVSIPADAVLDGHSDADAAAHAVIDAVLGAAGEGDIGQWFPPHEERWRDADSVELLATVWASLARKGYLAGNLDVTIIAEHPRVSPHYREMKRALSAVLCCSSDAVNIKATTMEGLGAIGRSEGIAAMASVLLFRPANLAPACE